MTTFGIIIICIIITRKVWIHWNMRPNWNKVTSSVWWPWQNKWDDRKPE